MSLTTRNYGTPTAPRGSAQTPAHWAWCRPTTESGCEHWTWCPIVLSQRRKGSPNAHLAALVSVEPEFRPIAEFLSGLRSRSKTDQDADGTTRGLPPTAATRPPAQSGRGALAGAVGHRHRPGVPLTIVTATSERSARATGPSLTWSSAARSQSVSTAREHPAGHHAARSLALGGGDTRLRRGARSERQRRSKARL